MKRTQKTESTFAHHVWRVICALPRGQVRSYSQVALAAGFPGAGRAVGTLMKHNFDPMRPCHRVVRADGTLGQYNRGVTAKARLLRAEGVLIRRGRIVAA
ncbi:MAG: MGMT family protein [Candidatus Moranbacteria bacterium]|nr:MGMT family protein [Candidatus Moranbacteria bacterium]